MKHGPSKLDLPYFFRKRLLGRVSLTGGMETAKPESIPETTEHGSEDILRWADDGGKVLDVVENQTAGSNPDGARERKIKN